MKKKESELERACNIYARSKGLAAIKLEKNGHKGIPDRMYIARGGNALFVEFKTVETKTNLSPEQNWWREFLTDSSHRVVFEFPDFVKVINEWLVSLRDEQCVIK